MCPTCGSLLPEDSGGVCAVCLLGVALTGQPASDDSKVAPLPSRVGQYRPVGVLGEGGMGIVYLAEQVEPVRRRVALKIVKQASGRQLLARFESERQALALMEHPNIARLYDAGETPEGHPYFAMEYVPGVPITDYCDRNHLACRERLVLFQQVCQAVHHAHQKGIIHRDLKPSNVLVMVRDGKPVPKVIDFGVAKAVNVRLTERTLFTEFGMLIGTPEYMSPEQADANAVDIDITTDIYSLGVLVYELLVGTTPFDSKTLRRAGYDEIRRVIREEEPPRPTTRLHSLGQTATDVAKRRGGDMASLVRIVGGDLEWITMKAIEKDRTRRYASASEFSADIDRYLRDEPVAAGPPGTGYQIRKFIRRHRLQVTAAAAVLLAILAGLIVTTYFLFRIQRERDLARLAEYKTTLAAALADIQAFRSREAVQELLQCPPGLRGWEWKHLYALADTSRASFATGQTAYPGRLAFAGSDARLVVARGRDVQVWNLESNTQEVSYGPFGEILALSHDGSRILARPGNDPQSVEMIEPSTGTRLAAWGEQHGPVIAAAFSRDGRRAATATRDGEVRLWQVATGKLVRAFQAPALIQAKAPSQMLALNSDGSRVSVVVDSSVLLWDAETGRLIASLDHAPCIVNAIYITSRDRLLSACDALRMWDAATGKPLQMFAPKTAIEARTVAASDDGSLVASGTFGHGLQLWSEGRVAPIASICIRETPAAMAFSPSGRYLVSWSIEGQIQVWDAPTAGNQLLRWGVNGMLGFRMSPDGSRLVVLEANGVELLDARTGRRLAFTAASTRGLAVHPRSGAVATTSAHRTISLWSPDLSPLGVIEGPFAGPVATIAFDPVRPRIAVGTTTGVVEIWDLERRVKVAATNVGTRVRYLGFSADGRKLVASVGESNVTRAGGAVRIFDGISGRQMAESSHPPGSLRFSGRPAFSPNGTEILTGLSVTGKAVVYDLEGRLLAEFSEGMPVIDTAFTPDGSRALVAHWDGILEVWDTKTWQLMAKLYDHGANSLFFSPDGTRLYALDQNDLRVYSTEILHPR